MVAVVTPHRTHGSLVRYVAHLVAWWLYSGLGGYGLHLYGGPYRVDWREQMPRYWRSEARRCVRECERALGG
jgi:hypothetical protein